MMAEKHGHPLTGITTLDQSILEGSGKGGLSPLPPLGSMIMENPNPVNGFMRDVIEDYQKNRMKGFTIQDLIDMEVSEIYESFGQPCLDCIP